MVRMLFLHAKPLGLEVGNYPTPRCHVWCLVFLHAMPLGLEEYIGRDLLVLLAEGILTIVN